MLKTIFKLNDENIKELVNIFKQYGDVNVNESSIHADFDYTGDIIIETKPTNNNPKMQLILGHDKRVFAEYSTFKELMLSIDHIFDTKRYHETQVALDLDAEEYHIENRRLEREGAILDAKLRAKGIDVDNLTLDEQFEYGYFDL